MNLESRFVTWKYILGHSGDLWSEDRLMGLACSHAWKPVKTRRRGWPDPLFRRTFKLKAFLFTAFDLPWHAVKTILWYQSLGLCSDQTNRFFVYISDVILQCCRCRTRAHASAWGLSGERLVGFSLFCFLKIQRFSNPNYNERDHQVGRLTNLSGEKLLRFSLIFLPFCFLFIHSALYEVCLALSTLPCYIPF